MSEGLRFLRGAALAAVLGMAAGGSYVAFETLSPWPALAVLKHAAALAGCETAYDLGLTPAERGEPGYWPQHDGDGDGIACERWRNDDDEGPANRRWRSRSSQ